MISAREEMHANVLAWTDDLIRILKISENLSKHAMRRVKTIKSILERTKEEKGPEIIPSKIHSEDREIYVTVRSLACALRVDDGVYEDTAMGMGHVDELRLTNNYETLYELMETTVMYAQYAGLEREARRRESRRHRKLPHD